MSQSKPVIYTSSASFANPQRVRLFSYEKGCENEYTEEILEMTGKGDHKSWKYTKLNPMGLTPTLKLEDGTCITEAAAIQRYMDGKHPGRKILGETVLEQALDSMWDQRIQIHLLLNMTTAFHVSQGGLGPAVDLTVNDAWGEHSRKQALVTAAVIDKHLSDGREWIIGGKEPTAADITLCTAMASGKSDDFKLDLTHRFEFLDAHWQRWTKRESFKKAFADGAGLPELEYLKQQ